MNHIIIFMGRGKMYFLAKVSTQDVRLSTDYLSIT